MAVVVLLQCEAKSRPTPPKAARGLLDLREWDFSKHGPVALNGEWEFYPRRLLSSADFSAGELPQIGYLPVPFSWNGREVNGRAMGGSDFGTYRLRILANTSADDVALRIGSLGTAFELDVDGMTRERVGIVSADADHAFPETRPRVLPVSFHREIILRISNHHHDLGGFWEPMLLGNRADLTYKWNQEGGFELLIIGSLGILCLYHLIFFSLRRSELSLFYFGLFCGLLTLRAATTGHRWFRDIVIPVDWPALMRMEHVSIFLAVPAAALFLRSIFPREVHRLIPISLFYIGGVSTLITFLPMQIWTKIVFPFLGLVIAVTLYFFVIMILALRRRREGSIVFSAGFLVLAAAVLRDILFTFEVIRSGDYLAPFGVLGFAFSQAVLLSSRLAASFVRTENLSAELAMSNRQLTSLKDTLEDRVVQRTHALEAARHEADRSRIYAEKMNEFARSVNSAVDLHDLFLRIGRGIREVYEVDGIWLLLVDQKTGELYTFAQQRSRLLYVHPDQDESARAYIDNFRVKIEPSLGTMYDTLKSGEPLYVPDIRSARGGVRMNPVTGKKYRTTSADRKLAYLGRLRSFVEIPLLLGDESIGILCLTKFAHALELSTDDISGLVRFCDQLTAAVHKAQMLESLDRERERAEKARAEIESLAEITRRINAMTHLDEILDHAYAYLRDSFQMDAVWLVMVDNEREELRAYNGIIRDQYDTPERRAYVSSMRMPLDPHVGTIWHVIRRRRPGYLYRLRDAAVGDLDKTAAEALGIKSVGYVPLVIMGKVIGILGYCTIGERRSLSRSRQGTIERFCDQIAGAIHNARLLGEAEESREKLAEVDRQKTAFFQNISHELRTPLTLIAGPLEKASRNGKPLEGQALEIAAANTRRLQRLVNQLLDVQKIAAGRMQVVRAPVRIRPMMEAIHAAFLPYAKSRGINLEVQLGEAVTTVVADADQVEKCVFNYLSNALKFTPSGGKITLSASVSRSDPDGFDRTEDPAVVISVADTGAGVAPEKRPRLFERFGFSESSLTRDQEGTGLGLSLVREFVEMHGGRVGAESEPGRGSIFWLSLPVSAKHAVTPEGETGEAESLPASAALHNAAALELGGLGRARNDAPAAWHNPTPPAATGEKHTVLIVEDNPDLQSYMSEIFREAGYEIHLAADGQEGLRSAHVRRPDLVITDLMMPKMSGIDLIQRMRQSPPLRTLPVILLTAKGDDDTRREVREAGADDFLAKPFSDLELLAVARNVISLKGRERELLKDLARAREIQQGLLPSSLPDVPGIEVAAIYEPMELVGGDLYDFVELPGGRLGVILADVSGHGLPAAMIASMLKLFISLFAPNAASPSALISSMNEMLFGRLADHFLTCVYVIVDPAAGRVTYARAGHPPFLVISNGSVTYHTCRGHAVGFLRTGRYEEGVVDVGPGDRIVLYTDGVTEARSGGELFEEDRLAECALGASSRPLGIQLNEIMARLREFQQGVRFDDDVTLVGLRVIG